MRNWKCEMRNGELNTGRIAQDRSSDLHERTRSFSLRILRLVRALPNTIDGRAVASQLVRSLTSVGANYWSACRARSAKEFVAKLGIVEEEADESIFWMELIIRDKMMKDSLVSPLLAEAKEILAIVVASQKTARRAIKPRKQS